MNYSDYGSGIIEPELLGPTPRRVCFNSEPQRTRRTFVIAAAATIVIAVLYYMRPLQDLMGLYLHGVATAAVVTGTREETIKGTKTDYVDYTFTVEGVKVVGEEPVTAEVYAQTHPGAIEQVTYLPGHPATQRAGIVDAASVTAEIGRMMTGAFLILIVLGVVCLQMESGYRLQYQLLQNGTPAIGQVTGRIASIGSNGSDYGLVTYLFECPAGTQTNTITVYFADFFYACVEGTTFTVLYNPMNPSENKPYRIVDGVSLA